MSDYVLLLDSSVTNLELVPKGSVDHLRRRLLRKTMKHINTEQTLRSTRLRYEELKEDYAALKEDYTVLKKEFDELRAAWDGHMSWLWEDK